MPRNRITHDLDPLPPRSSVEGGGEDPRKFTEFVRSLALKNQREEPRAFYSLREVARKYHIPVSAVAAAYRKLEKDGLLSRVRSSRTVLNGVRLNRRITFRGLIGLPALLPHYIALPEYRNFFTTMRQELWLRGFAATTVFFHPEEATSEKLTERLRELGVDTVIWVYPGRTKETFLRLADIGIQGFRISAIGTPGFPSRYYIWRENAIEALLRDVLKQDDSRPLTIIESPQSRSPVTEEVIRVMVMTAKIPHVIKRYAGEALPDFLQALRESETKAIIFPAAGFVAMLAFRCPDELTRLCEARRVAFIDGPFEMPFAKIPDVLVDLVAPDWQPVAETIVNDLVTRTAFDQNRHTTFLAEAHLRVPISNFCQEMHLPRSIGAPS